MSRHSALAAAMTAPVHSDWHTMWLPDLNNQRLAAKIGAEPRFHNRMRRDLAGCKAPLPVEIENGDALCMALDRVMSYSRTRLTKQLGFLWFAPSLANQIFQRTTRNASGITDRDDLRAIMRYKDHVAKEHVGTFGSPAEYDVEGLRCFLAWLAPFPLAYGCTLQLMFPRAPIEDARISRARAEFAASIFSDSTLHWQEVAS